MIKDFFLVFGSGSSQDYSGLTPTFLFFKDKDGNNVTAPSIAEVGVSTGFYHFQASLSPTLPYIFLADGGATITDDSIRYLKGSLDPIAALEKSMGFLEDSYGGTLSPSTIFGYVKRADELVKADATFDKSTGVWQKYVAGASTLLMQKTLSNTTAEVTKS